MGHNWPRDHLHDILLTALPFAPHVSDRVTTCTACYWPRYLLHRMLLTTWLIAPHVTDRVTYCTACYWPRDYLHRMLLTAWPLALHDTDHVTTCTAWHWPRDLLHRILLTAWLLAQHNSDHMHGCSDHMWLLSGRFRRVMTSVSSDFCPDAPFEVAPRDASVGCHVSRCWVTLAYENRQLNSVTVNLTGNTAIKPSTAQNILFRKSL